jgi:gluconolactonase
MKVCIVYHAWLVVLVFLGAPAWAQEKGAAGTFVTETADAKVELVADGYKFTEGPAVDSRGNVFFTDQPNDRILKVDVEGKVTEFMKPAGRSNGLYFTKDDVLIACADEKNEMWAIQKDGTYKVLFKDFEGKKLNGPNDCWIDANGSIYFTDPYYQRPWWEHKSQPQRKQAVYRVDPDGANITMVDDSMKQPNGIIGDAKKRILYVSDIGDKKTYRYKIANDGSLVDRELFCSAGSDGMTLDSAGNLYITNTAGVTVFEETGKQVQVIPTGKGWTANVCLGGPDRKTLYITASDSLFRIRMKHAGLLP